MYQLEFFYLVCISNLIFLPYSYLQIEAPLPIAQTVGLSRLRAGLESSVVVWYQPPIGYRT